MDGREKQLGRRDALVGIGIGIAGAAIGGGLVLRDVEAPLTATREPSAPAPTVAHGLAEASEEVRALFGELRDIEGWRIERTHAVRSGAIPLVMSRGSRRFAVEIFARDTEGALPVAVAGSLALFLVNHGDGARPTPQLEGLGVRALARALDARIAGGAPIPSGLWTHAERHRRAPTGVFHVPV